MEPIVLTNERGLSIGVCRDCNSFMHVKDIRKLSDSGGFLQNCNDVVIEFKCESCKINRNIKFIGNPKELTMGNPLSEWSWKEISGEEISQVRKANQNG